LDLLPDKKGVSIGQAELLAIRFGVKFNIPGNHANDFYERVFRHDVDLLELMFDSYHESLP